MQNFDNLGLQETEIIKILKLRKCVRTCAKKNKNKNWSLKTCQVKSSQDIRVKIQQEWDTYEKNEILERKVILKQIISVASTL